MDVPEVGALVTFLGLQVPVLWAKVAVELLARGARAALARLQWSPGQSVGMGRSHMGANIHSFWVILATCAVCLLLIHGFYFLFFGVCSLFSSQPIGLLLCSLYNHCTGPFP